MVTSIEIASVKEIFILMNNFAVIYIQHDDPKSAITLLNCAIQISKQYKEIMSISTLATCLYNNLSLYHVKVGKGKAVGEQTSKYIDGAILVNRS